VSKHNVLQRRDSKYQYNDKRDVRGHAPPFVVHRVLPSDAEGLLNKHVAASMPLTGFQRVLMRNGTPGQARLQPPAEERAGVLVRTEEAQVPALAKGM